VLIKILNGDDGAAIGFRAGGQSTTKSLRDRHDHARPNQSSQRL
jgi:hypothetical protein